MKRAQIIYNQLGGTSSQIKTTKKPLNIWIATDVASDLTQNIVNLFGMGHIFPIDQPMVLHICSKNHQNFSLCEMSSSFIISHSLVLSSWECWETVRPSIDLVIIDSQQVDEFVLFDNKIVDKEIKSNLLRFMVVSNNPLNVLEYTTKLAQKCPYIKVQNIQGLSKPFNNLYISSLVEYINNNMYQIDVDILPVVALRNKTYNVFFSSLPKSNTIKPSIKYGIIADYPTQGRVVPLVTILDQIKTSSPQQQFRYDFNKNIPLNLQATGIVQQLFEWFEGTQPGVVTTFCIVQDLTQNQRVARFVPCQSYHGNVAVVSEMNDD